VPSYKTTKTFSKSVIVSVGLEVLISFIKPAAKSNVAYYRDVLLLGQNILVTATRKYQRGLSRLMHDDLPWLVIPQRVQYKLAVTVYRCLRHRSPWWYLTEDCVPVSEVPGRQPLRSARCHQLSVLRVRRSTFATSAFSVAGPTVWNSLPDRLRDPAGDSVQFRRDLKTYLFAGHSRCHV